MIRTLLPLAVTLWSLGLAVPAGAQCRVAGSAPADDLARAAAGCERAAERFSLLYGFDAPAGVVEVSDTVLFFAAESTAPGWKLIWPNSRRLAEFFADPLRGEPNVAEAVELHWTGVLPHEIGHLMLIAAAEARRRPDRPARRLPDWLHEGTAVWMEPPSYRASDHGILRALQPYVPPLDELLSHAVPQARDEEVGGSVVVQTFFPCASEEACGGRPYWNRIFSVTTRQFPDGRVQVDTTLLSRPPPPPNPLASNFYTYAAVLVRYLYDRGGPSAMRELLDRYVAAEGARVSLTGLPGLPRDRRALEADWQTWFRAAVFRPEPPR